MDALATIQPSSLPTAGRPQNRTEPIQSIVKAIAADDISLEFIAKVPIAFARRFGVLGLSADNGVMRIALASQTALVALDKITALLGVATEPVSVPEDVLRQAIDRAYGQQETGIEHVIGELTGDSAAVKQLSESGDLLDCAGASPVTRLVNLILLDAVKRRASDVHFQPSADGLTARLRIDGVLYDYVEPPAHLRDEITSRIKVMGRMNIAEKRLPQDGRTTVMVGDKTIDLRISSLPTCFGERIVLRLLDKSARLYRLPELGMPSRELATFRNLIRKTHGIILVCGPTGSGKSTTLYAALQEINAKELNVVTLEDPIEYRLQGISQSQVSNKKGMTFATGLRTVLRQDPDVIMVGEIRDQETARMAIQSSLTGHLVFSTLHTNDAPGAVARLLDLGVEPYLVAGSLLGILAQRLIRRVCTACRVPRPLSEADCRALNLKHSSSSEIFDASGCAQCQNTGYRDRMGIFELLPMNEELHDLIVGNPKASAIKAAARRNGMRTLREEAIARMLEGATTPEEVLRVTHADS